MSPFWREPAAGCPARVVYPATCGGIHTALDSNGRLIDQAAKDLLAETDLLLLDVAINDMAPRLTGLSNVNSEGRLSRIDWEALLVAVCPSLG